MMEREVSIPAEALAVLRTYRPIEKLVPAHWHEGDVPVNDGPIHYYRTGNGDKPPLLLLHGFEEYGLSWLRVARELEGEYDVIMVDARGHGHSVKTGYTLGANVEDTVSVIQALKLEGLRVLGFSMGIETAKGVTIRCPELVHSIILAGWWTGEGAISRNEGFMAWARQFQDWLVQLKTMSFEEQLISALSYSTLLPEEEYVPMVEGYALFDPELGVWELERYLSTPRKSSNEGLKELRQVSCPVLVMQHDGHIAGAEAVVREVPSEQSNVRIVFFENSGHLIQRYAAEQYMKLVREFFREN